eukprot:Plantae.Rhodophyta-Purpureofilum_apyrenoidigerum.ctg25199.p1 GENE.Plantae.Rhodophyta-Purpureofilum_apyrenoidigerum.ctg25199~~Plantae.Rhodophyta-Purpureofilum_apyrenoidigerum.ctg25199.p1  ORF type:complete len:474 (-),score=81.28 Plantae.Rhodophyta-Purpureofilum_apyrenoidigerum.ctg25199:847-2268(-)
MDDIKKKYNAIDWVSLRRSAGKLKARAASNFKDMVMTDIENSVRAATSDTTWGVTGTELDTIARATFNREEYPLVMGIVWERLSAKKWRNVYKTMELLKYLCLHGSQRCLDEAKDALPHIQGLQNFRYVDSTGKDEGRNVRERAKQLTELLNDPDRLAEEKEKVKSLQAKLGDQTGRVAAVSSDDYRYNSELGNVNEGQTSQYDDPYRSSDNGGYNEYQNNNYGYDDYGYGDNEGGTQPQANVNAGLDDLLGLNETPALPSSTVAAALPASGSFDAFGGGNAGDGTDLFSSNYDAATAAKSSLNNFGTDVLAALPAPSSNTGASTTGASGLDLFGSTDTSVQSSAPVGSGLDLFGMTSNSAAVGSVVGQSNSFNTSNTFEGFSSPTSTAATAAPAPVATNSVAPKKTGGFDSFGDLVNFDNIGQVSKQEKRHSVQTETSLNSLSSSHVGGQTSSTQPTKTANNTNDHDLLFGL